MEYICGLCKKHVEGDILQFKDHTDRHIIDLIKHDHPDWVEQDGLCPQCAHYYQSEMKGSIFKDVPCALRNRKIKSFWNKIKDVLRLS